VRSGYWDFGNICFKFSLEYRHGKVKHILKSNIMVEKTYIGNPTTYIDQRHLRIFLCKASHTSTALARALTKIHTQKISATHVIKLGFAPKAYPPGQHHKTSTVDDKKYCLCN
jgi:hypothetical protein